MDVFSQRPSTPDSEYCERQSISPSTSVHSAIEDNSGTPLLFPNYSPHIPPKPQNNTHFISIDHSCSQLRCEESIEFLFSFVRKSSLKDQQKSKLLAYEQHDQFSCEDTDFVNWLSRPFFYSFLYDVSNSVHAESKCIISLSNTILDNHISIVLTLSGSKSAFSMSRFFHDISRQIPKIATTLLFSDYAHYVAIVDAEIKQTEIRHQSIFRTLKNQMWRSTYRTCCLVIKNEPLPALGDNLPFTTFFTPDNIFVTQEDNFCTPDFIIVYNVVDNLE